MREQIGTELYSQRDLISQVMITKEVYTTFKHFTLLWFFKVKEGLCVWIIFNNTSTSRIGYARYPMQIISGS